MMTAANQVVTDMYQVDETAIICWVCAGELAIQCSPEQLQPFAAPIVERLVPILAAPMAQMPRSIVENRSAVSLTSPHISSGVSAAGVGSGMQQIVFLINRQAYVQHCACAAS